MSEANKQTDAKGQRNLLHSKPRAKWYTRLCPDSIYRRTSEREGERERRETRKRTSCLSRASSRIWCSSQVAAVVAPVSALFGDSGYSVRATPDRFPPFLSASRLFIPSLAVRLLSSSPLAHETRGTRTRFPCQLASSSAPVCLLPPLLATSVRLLRLSAPHLLRHSSSAVALHRSSGRILQINARLLSVNASDTGRHAGAR